MRLGVNELEQLKEAVTKCGIAGKTTAGEHRRGVVKEMASGIEMIDGW